MTDRNEASLGLEICVDSLRGAELAQAGGADRIELCSELALDGLSPGDALLRSVRAAVALPIVVMVRPLPGPFRATAETLGAMRDEVRRARDEGCEGLVLGLLRDDDTVDTEAVASLVEAAGDLPVTFHRAFDATPDASAALASVRSAGVARVLSSGHAPDAVTGAEGLASLVAASGPSPEIVVGGGVRPANVAELVERTGARWFHSSAWGPGEPSVEPVRALRKALDRSRPTGSGSSPMR